MLHDDPMLPRPATVRGRTRELETTWTLEFDLDGVAFAPGQFTMLYVPDIGEIPISISGDPADGGRLVHTVRSVGPVSEALAGLRAGDSVGVRGPFGSGWPVEEAAGGDVVLIAGGIGLAPLRPVIYGLLAARERYGNIAILYGARGPGEILYRRELGQWREHLDLQVEVTVDHGDADWRGHVGVVTGLVGKADFDPAETTVMVCGPEIMMRFAVAAMRDRGIADESIYLSMERNMQCAIGHCGHCQFGTFLVCRDGPVFRYDRIRRLLNIKEL